MQIKLVVVVVVVVAFDDNLKADARDNEGRGVDKCSERVVSDRSPFFDEK